MAVNMLETIRGGMPPSFANMTSGLLGESGAATSAALAALVPIVLAGIARKGASDSGAQSVMSMLNNSTVDTSLLVNLGSVFGAGGAQANSMMGAGNSIASSIFGDKVGALGSALSQVAGLAKPQSASSLIGLVVPIVLAFIKRHVAAETLSAGGLSALLGSQGPFLTGTLDAGLTSALGFSDPDAMVAGLFPKTVEPSQSVTFAEAAPVAVGESRSMFARWWPWLVGAIIVLFILSRWMTVQTPVEPAGVPPASTATPTPSNATPNPPAATSPPPAAPTTR